MVLGTRLLLADNRQAVAASDTGRVECASPQLDDSKCAESAHDAPCGHVGANLQHAAIARGEQDVDGKTHEEGVHHAGWRDDQRLPCGKIVAAKQAAVPRSGVERRLERRGDRQARTYVAQHAIACCAASQRLKKVRFQGRFVRMMGTRIRYRTGWPFNLAGLNFHAFAAATSIRS
jgi:hypothetical protein